MLNKIREPVSAITHFIGMILAIIGLIILLIESTNPPKPWHILAFSIFGVSMFVTYTASTLYHWLNVPPAKIELLKKLDQAIEAFNILGYSLRIIGTGNTLKKLKNISGPNIDFLGFGIIYIK